MHHIDGRIQYPVGVEFYGTGVPAGFGANRAFAFAIGGQQPFPCYRSRMSFLVSTKVPACRRYK